MLRLSLGAMSLIVGILFAAHGLRLLPDRERALVDGRKQLCESLAIHCSLSARTNDVDGIARAAEALLRRSPDLISAGVRGPDGRLVVTAGDHPRQWVTENDGASTPTHMHLPVSANGRA